jgi:hypothetical protein
MCGGPSAYLVGGLRRYEPSAVVREPFTEAVS